MAKGSENFQYSEVHYIELKNPVEIPRNSTYSVVIKQHDSKNQYYFGIARGVGKNLFDAYNNLKSNILKSYTWYDEKDLIPDFEYYKNDEVDEVDEVEHSWAVDNFPIMIKAFVRPSKTETVTTPTEVPIRTIEDEEATEFLN